MALVEQAAGRAQQRGRRLLVREHRLDLGLLRLRELFLALRDEEVRGLARDELALLDLEVLRRQLAELRGRVDLARGVLLRADRVADGEPDRLQRLIVLDDRDLMARADQALSTFGTRGDVLRAAARFVAERKN